MPMIGSPSRYEVKHARINATADGDNTVISAVSGKKIRVLSYVINANAAGVVTLQNTDGTPVVYASFELTDGGTVVYPGGVFAPAFETAVGTGLEISNAVGVDALGHITYQEVS